MNAVLARMLALGCALLWATSAFAADITDDFRLYYKQQVAAGGYKGPLDFLRDDGNGDSLTDSCSRWAKLDRASGRFELKK